MFSQFEIPELLYDKLMKFIRLNKKIPNFLNEEIPHNLYHKENISILEKAIKEGDVNCLVFNDENCLGYLIYLIRENKITESQATTASWYLMALKSPYDIKIVNINSENPEDQVFKEQFIETMLRKANEGGLKVDANKIREEIAKLQGMDSWLMIATPKKLEKYSDMLDKDEELLYQINPTPFFDYDSRIKSKKIIFSSAAIMNSFLFEINLSPIFCFLMFGKINATTLKTLHALGYHPVPLHGGDFVKTNMEYAHGVYVSPLIMILHDLYHIYSGSLLKKSDHIYLFNTLIPILDKVVDKLNQHSTNKNERSSFIQQLENLSAFLADMDIGVFAGNKGSASDPDFFSSWLVEVTFNIIFKSKKMILMIFLQKRSCFYLN